MTDDRLAALLRDAMRASHEPDAGQIVDWHEWIAARLAAAGVTVALACPHGAEWDGRIWTKVQPATWEQMYADHVRLRAAIHQVATVCSDGDRDAHPHAAHFDCDWFADQLADALKSKPAPDALRAAAQAYWKEHPAWLDPDEDGCATSASLRAALGDES